MSRREKIDFVLYGQHFGAGRQQTEGGVSAGTVGDRRDHAAVHTSVLLDEGVAEGQFDFDPPWLDLGEDRPDRRHDLLALETATHIPFEMRILRVEAGHGFRLM